MNKRIGRRRVALSRANAWTRLLLGAAVLSAQFILVACPEREETEKSSSHDRVVEPIEVAATDTEVSYRFVDPETGTVATAVEVDAIPQAARSQVVVYHALRPTPPGWEHVANLSSGLPVTTWNIAGGRPAS